MGNPGRRPSTGTFFGLLLIAVGVLWGLHNTRMVNLPIRVWWPLILIGIGLLHLYHHRRIFDFFGGLMTGLGVVFLLTANNIVGRHELGKYWPLLLVLFGFFIIFKKGTSRGGSRFYYKYCQHKKESGHEAEDVPSGGAARINESTLFGSLSKKINDRAFKGGSISVIFGGAEIDLRAAGLAEEGAVLDISALFGGVELRIPEAWAIENRSTAILGAVETKYANTESNSGKRLVINSSAIFGGVEIKN
jgi:predicted membrane protein